MNRIYGVAQNNIRSRFLRQLSKSGVNPLLINGHIRPRLSAAARRRSRLLFYSAPDLHRLLAISMFLNPSSCNPDRDVKRRRDDRVGRLRSLACCALQPRILLQ